MVASAAPAASRAASRLRRRGYTRAAAAIVILLAWATGISALVHREFFGNSRARLAEAAQRVNPGALFYIVEQGGQQVGFASSTIDTMPTSIDLVDYFIAAVPGTGTPRRLSARSVVQLSRLLLLRTFDVQTESPASARRVVGRTEGDTAIVYTVTGYGQRANSRRVAVPGPMLLPTLVPLAVALGETPRIGRRYTLPLFSPGSATSSRATFVIRAESVFRMIDSAAVDSIKGKWVGASTDTIRAWLVEPIVGTSDGAFTGWVDAAGRVVQRTEPGGFTLRRTAYELAFENWRIARDRATTSTGTETHDILERTAIAAGVSPGRTQLGTLTVTLSDANLRGYALAGGRQLLAGDTLKIRQEADSDLVPNWSLIRNSRLVADRYRVDLREEALLQVHDPRIVNLAVRIAGQERDPRLIAETINQWVHDSVRNVSTFGIPNAVEVLRKRMGDSSDHTQLAVALTRALGIPARIANGFVYLNGKFYLHTWPEVYLHDWVATDPTFGQFPADASHLRFVTGGPGGQTEMLRLAGGLHIQIIEAR